MEKLVICIMGQNCEKFISMCLDSVKDADAIVYCDGGSIDNTLNICDKFMVNNGDGETSWGGVELIQNKYNQNDKAMNGKQRNFYLDYLKKNYKGWWCLALDADEVLDDNGIKKLKEFINFIPKQNNDILFSPKIRHFVGGLGHEDATQSTHFVPNRLFKICDKLKYEEVEHSVLCHDRDMRMEKLILTTIWHLRETLGIFEMKNKFKWNTKKSNMHSKDNLRHWYNSMIFGFYPTKRVPHYELPSAIKKEFLLE